MNDGIINLVDKVNIEFHLHQHLSWILFDKIMIINKVHEYHFFHRPRILLKLKWNYDCSFLKCNDMMLSSLLKFIDKLVIRLVFMWISSQGIEY